MEVNNIEIRKERVISLEKKCTQMATVNIPLIATIYLFVTTICLDHSKTLRK